MVKRSGHHLIKSRKSTIYDLLDSSKISTRYDSEVLHIHFSKNILGVY